VLIFQFEGLQQQKKSNSAALSALFVFGSQALFNFEPSTSNPSKEQTKQIKIEGRHVGREC
jgi:hypothetical protein